MELTIFDVKGLLFSLLFFFTTCQMSAPVSVTAPETSSIILPKGEGQKNYDSVATKLTLILLANDKIYAYEGTDVNTGNYYQFKTIRERIKQSQKKFSKKNFVIIIKPGAKTTYSNTVDLLDEMVINNISKYAIVDLTQQEKRILNAAD